MSSDLNSHERYAIWDRAMARILLALHALTTCERKEFLDPLLALTWRKSEAERQFRHHNYVNIGSQKRLQERGFPVDTLADDIFPKLPERWKADPDVDLFFSSLFGGHQVSLEIARLGEDFKSTAAKLSKDEAEGKARLDYFFHRTSDLNNLARDIDVTVSQLYTSVF